MRKVLIVDCNAKLGGIQKALIAYIKTLSETDDVTLQLFYKSGPLLREIPSNVTVLDTGSDLRFMGMAQADCRTPGEKLKRAIYVLISKVFGQGLSAAIARSTGRAELTGPYDEAISYTHVTNRHSFFGGTPQYVLSLPNVKTKTCFVHCDYLRAGYRSRYSDRLYAKFDKIVCVSKSTRDIFLQALPELRGKVTYRYNDVDADRINELSNREPYAYDKRYFNLITVARFTREKGVARFVDILSRVKSSRLRYYLVGDGQDKAAIADRVREAGLGETVFFLGEQENPYRYMKNADLLVVPSYHEAAPVVFQEAIVLGLPVLTTRTSSADEMIGTAHGIVVENDDESLYEAVAKLAAEFETAPGKPPVLC